MRHELGREPAHLPKRPGNQFAEASPAPCGSVADQRGKHEINGCRQFDPGPVGRLEAPRRAEHAISQTPNTVIAVIGIDIGKNSFHVVGHDARGAIVLRQKWSRGEVEARLANIPPCLIGMEACVGAHHLSRKLASLGHDARLMPAKYVRPYSKGQKSDFNDAEAIAEAVQRPTMKFVATKTAEQLDLQALHRVRERLVSQRTGIINQIRAFMLERGIAVRQGIGFLRTELPTILATRTDALSPRMLRVIEELAGDWRWLDQRIGPSYLPGCGGPVRSGFLR